MFHKTVKLAVIVAVLLTGITVNSSAQKAGDGTVAQRLQVMGQKLETMRRSIKSVLSVLEQENKDSKDEKANADTPFARLSSLEKEVSRLQSDVNNLRGKSDRGEKFEPADVDQAEQSVSEIQVRVDKALTDSAVARAAPESPVGKPREIKKKKKFLGIFGGGGNDEYDELIGTVSPGRDRELFIVATREVRKKNFDVWFFE